MTKLGAVYTRLLDDSRIEQIQTRLDAAAAAFAAGNVGLVPSGSSPGDPGATVSMDGQ